MSSFSSPIIIRENVGSTLSFLTAATAWAFSSGSAPSSANMSSETESQCPVTGHKAVGSGCPFSQGVPLPDPAHRCDPNSLDERKVPDVPPLTDRQRELIKATVPILAEHGVKITTHFYRNMISAHSELRDVFSESSQKLGHQPRALAESVYAYAANIDDLTPILPVVDHIAYKHTALHITPDMYGLVGKHLIQSLVDILGDAVTPELGDAWYNGYWNLAHIFINREKEFYTTAIEAGGWEGWRAFKVDKRVKESEEITSFYLKPVEDNGKPLPKHHPGQYLGVSLDIPGLGYKQTRQYSLSEPSNGEYFRISVKREDGVPIPSPSNPEVPSHPGWMSNLLHKSLHEGDHIDVASPYGEFFYEPSTTNPNAPLVLLSAGVGQTALFCILQSQIGNSARPITYATVARTKGKRAFGDRLAEITKQHRNVTSRVFLSSPEGGAILGKDYDYQGRFVAEKIKDTLHLDDKTAEYYLCGPQKFMIERRKELRSFGVEDKRIHLELFSTGGLPDA